MNGSRIASAELGLRHVFLRDMVLQARIGVYPHEQTAPQRIRINVDLAVHDPAAPGQSHAAVGRDDLSRVVDYSRLADDVRAVVGAGHVQLVETLAERIAEIGLQDPRARLVRVRVEKLDVFADAASAGVEIERRRR